MSEVRAPQQVHAPHMGNPGSATDKVRIEMMTNDDNLESNLLISSLLKMCCLVQVGTVCLLPGGRR